MSDTVQLELKKSTYAAIKNIHLSFYDRPTRKLMFWGASPEKRELYTLLSTLSQRELAEITALRFVGRARNAGYELEALIDTFLAQDSFSPLQRISKDRELDRWITVGMAKSQAKFADGSGIDSEKTECVSL